MIRKGQEEIIQKAGITTGTRDHRHRQYAHIDERMTQLGPAERRVMSECNIKVPKVRGVRSGAITPCRVRTVGKYR